MQPVSKKAGTLCKIVILLYYSCKQYKYNTSNVKTGQFHLILCPNFFEICWHQGQNEQLKKNNNN